MNRIRLLFSQFPGFSARLAALFLLTVVVCTPQLVKAQGNDLEFANYYFDKGEYDKAALYFQKLWDRTANPYYYQRLLASLISQEKYEDAEDLIRKQLKRASAKSEVYVDLVSLYKKTGSEKKKQKAKDEVLDNLEPVRATIVVTARKLMEIGEMETAEEVYRKGITLLRGDYNFALELADIYGAKGNLPKMVEAYIDLIGANPSYVPSVQNMLNRYLNLTEEPERADLVKGVLLKAIQKNPENTIYNEMLVWLFLQTKNFSAALVQLKALDKRYSENGQRILEFAEMCLKNGEYDVASSAFGYLIESQKEPYMMELGHVGKARAEFMKLQEINVPDPKVTEVTGRAMKTAITELGTSNATVDLIMDYAQFLVKYRNRLDSAVILLESTAAQASLTPKKIGEVKLALGDLMVSKGDIWDASLYYSQVDKAFKEDVLGAEAKFRNAKISYYTGDFEWAQDQLDVLKASTSKLISNDAMNLSLLITDNLGLDSIEEPLQMFAQADLLTYQNLLDQAEQKLDSLTFYYPAHSLADEILFEKAEIEMKRRNYAKAAVYLEKIIELYPTDLLGDDAVYKLAELNRKFLGNTQKASDLYKKIITEYPSSLFVVEARKQFRELRGDFTN
ncbi:MAG: tetratricopeptide repeat protein [Bacteroidota bacterium]